MTPESVHAAEPNQPFLRWSRQREATTFGLWIFLASEMVFFGALMMGYAMHRYLWPDAFEVAGAHTNIWYGSINTAILLTSSATMAVAAWAARDGLRRTVLTGLGLTAALGMAFLVLKGFEYREDFNEDLIPGIVAFPLDPPQTQIFFSYYWMMTGIHAVHLTIGIGAVLTVAWVVAKGRTDWTQSGTLHGLALYWHLIDVIWIFLYPLLYLVGRG
ncbi:heme/copper-type cytochrome/quinol oxidase, subunit 3 [Oceaniovalibus guishaninsula JLT2003]|uniref:Heme/copper-type cytochrome/quinol oxidase, subunit 3 n=1 Tax=Oceaniovalibus guishaninsula JLT2003 TaxID=1231392 RepID=K2HDI9_9RHOB|nr:cytochrome c oxidase subunit 3 [Oceaniovalibus guishaninsula]EKE44602.1 heme/copper-type cytochrome/quinol oxidase, subunit 3 [Oceaniovalibus guishaninsula JLT2003]